MEPPGDPLSREVSTYLSWAARVAADRSIGALTRHLTEAYEPADFTVLRERLAAADATGSFSILARDLDDLGDTVAALHDDGHEIVLHGLRHATFGGLDYDQAHDEIATALSAFEDAAGVRPRGFHVPFMDASRGALRAADDLGIEWLLARPDTEPPDGMAVLDPVEPWDTALLETEDEPAAVFDRLDRPPGPGEAFLMHPNVHAFYGGNAAFDDWLASRTPATVAESLCGDGDALVLDCVRPLRVT